MQSIRTKMHPETRCKPRRIIGRASGGMFKVSRTLACMDYARIEEAHQQVAREVLRLSCWPATMVGEFLDTGGMEMIWVDTSKRQPRIRQR